MEWKIQGFQQFGSGRLKMILLMWKKRDKGEATKATNGGQGGVGGSSRIGRRGGAVIGSKEAAEKVCLEGRRFMKYHSFIAVL